MSTYSIYRAYSIDSDLPSVLQSVSVISITLTHGSECFIYSDAGLPQFPLFTGRALEMFSKQKLNVGIKSADYIRGRWVWLRTSHFGTEIKYDFGNIYKQHDKLKEMIILAQY